MELFDRAADAGGQLLRVDRLTPADDGDAAIAVLLTFDVGRILLSADPGAGRLVATHIATGEDIPTGAENANEEEPWWRLLGSPLTRATESAGASRLELHFQVKGGTPRKLELRFEGGRLYAELSGDA